MWLSEIVYCYVRKRVPKPEDLPRLRHSFVESGFAEKAIRPGKWIYKRGAALALEFDYQSEALQVQIFLEEISDEIEISVGNWGFPFEPMLSKTRYKRILDQVTIEIAAHGVLQVRQGEAEEIAQLASKKKNLGFKIIVTGGLVALLSVLFGAT